MRILVIYAFVASMVGVAYALEAHRAHLQVAALEQQLAATQHVVTASDSTAHRRSWTSSNGVTFSGKDLDDLEAKNRESEKSAAELEYMLTHTSSKR